MNAYLHENLSGIRVVQSFAAETESLESFTELVDEQKKAFVGAVRVSDMFSPTIEISWGVGGFYRYKSSWCRCRGRRYIHGIHIVPVNVLESYQKSG